MYQVEAEDVMEREPSSVQDRILLSPMASMASRAATPLQLQQQRSGGSAPFGRQFSMARMAARIRRPRRWVQCYQIMFHVRSHSQRHSNM